jgi:hypothetical protein
MPLADVVLGAQVAVVAAVAGAHVESSPGGISTMSHDGPHTYGRPVFG